jgi:hypothetical protein
MAPSGRVYFLAKDPHWAFVWWRLSRRGLENAVCRRRIDLREARLTLRLLALGDGPPGRVAQEVEVIGETDHWYLRVEESGRPYRIELGFREPSGSFHAVAVSNVLELPPDRPAEALAGEWAEIGT